MHFNSVIFNGDHRGRVVDGAKTLDSSLLNTEWFIEAPPKPTNGCSGGCELNVQEVPGQESGQVTVSKNIEPTGLRVHVQASAPNSADYVPDSQPDPYSNDHKPLLYSLKNPTVFQTSYYVKWIPKLSKDITITILNATLFDTLNQSYASKIHFTFSANGHILTYPSSGTVDVSPGRMLKLPSDTEITVQARDVLNLGITLVDPDYAYHGKIFRVGHTSYVPPVPLTLVGGKSYSYQNNFGEGVQTLSASHVVLPYIPSPFEATPLPISDSNGKYGYSTRVLFMIHYQIAVAP